MASIVDSDSDADIWFDAKEDNDTEVEEWVSDLDTSWAQEGDRDRTSNLSSNRDIPSDTRTKKKKKKKKKTTITIQNKKKTKKQKPKENLVKRAKPAEEDGSAKTSDSLADRNSAVAEVELGLRGHDKMFPDNIEFNEATALQTNVVAMIDEPNTAGIKIDSLEDMTTPTPNQTRRGDSTCGSPTTGVEVMVETLKKEESEAELSLPSTSPIPSTNTEGERAISDSSDSEDDCKCDICMGYFIEDDSDETLVDNLEKGQQSTDSEGSVRKGMSQSRFTSMKDYWRYKLENGGYDNLQQFYPGFTSARGEVPPNQHPSMTEYWSDEPENSGYNNAEQFYPEYQPAELEGAFGGEMQKNYMAEYWSYQLEDSANNNVLQLHQGYQPVELEGSVGGEMQQIQNPLMMEYWSCKLSDGDYDRLQKVNPGMPIWKTQDGVTNSTDGEGVNQFGMKQYNKEWQENYSHYKEYESQEKSFAKDMGWLNRYQLNKLYNIMTSVQVISGRQNFPNLEIQLYQLVLKIKEMLEKSLEEGGAGLHVNCVKLNGGAASFVLAMDAVHYNDYDITFEIDLTESDLENIKHIVINSIRNFMSTSIQTENLDVNILSHAYVGNLKKVIDNENKWSLIGFGTTEWERSIELKFVSYMRRSYQFSVDSFEIYLDSFLNSFCNINSVNETAECPRVKVKCNYGNLKNTFHHLNDRLIVTKSPKDIRGGGLLKYCCLLRNGFKLSNRKKKKHYEDIMSARFFADHEKFSEQKNEIERYLKNHFFGQGNYEKNQFIEILHKVVKDAEKCTRQRDKRRFLKYLESTFFFTPHNLIIGGYDSSELFRYFYNPVPAIPIIVLQEVSLV